TCGVQLPACGSWVLAVVAGSPPWRRLFFSTWKGNEQMAPKNIPHQLDDWARRVDDMYRNFQTVFASDTSGWIISDSGGNSVLANYAIALKNTGSGNFQDQGGSGVFARGEAKLRACGQSTGIACDTGGQTTA